MHIRHLLCVFIATEWLVALSSPAAAQIAVPEDAPPDASAKLGEVPPLPTDNARVREAALGQGFVFHPSTTPVNAFRFGLGGLYDAIDPQVMYGIQVRVPQFTADARYGLGAGWSIKGHFNSMYVTNELLLGPAYSWRGGRWSIEGAASVGVYFGKLASFDFDAALISPEYRPEVAVGYDFGNIAVTARGSVLLMGPNRARVGDIWGGLDNSNLFVGHSEMIYVENPTGSGGVWYFGLGAMTTRAYYQFWVLFPDSPALFTYARTVAGYEF
jgi:hypothetical protein